MPLAMDFHPLCKQNFCRNCHASVQHQITERDFSCANYAKNTLQSRERLMRIAMESPRLQNMLRTPSQPRNATRKPRLPLYDETAKTSLMRLPVEVRLHIYRCCVYRENWKSHYRIKGWYKGGGAHTDDIAAGGYTKYHPETLLIYASHRFNPAILRLNSTIHTEASDELYRHIQVHVEASLSKTRLPQLRYWFMENPMRLARHVSFTLDFPTALSTPAFPRLPGYHPLTRPRSATTILQNADLLTLGNMLNSMPKLLQVDILLCPTNIGMGRAKLNTALLVKLCLKDEGYVARLRGLRDTLLKGVRLRLRVCFEDKFWGAQGYVRDFEAEDRSGIIERLRGEGFEAGEMEMEMRGVPGFTPSAKAAWAI